MTNIRTGHDLTQHLNIETNMISESTKLFLVAGGGGGGGGALVFSFGGCGAFRVFLDFFGLETTLKIVWTIYVLGKNYESNHFLQTTANLTNDNAH